MIIIDRIEGGMAVLLCDGQRVDLPVTVLPAGAQEGAVLRLELDASAEARTLAENEARLARLRARSPIKGGVLDL
jgi:hypothetical protein